MNPGPLLDPEFLPYRQLHGSRGALHPAKGPCFICEGHFLVESALAAGRAGKLEILSVLATPAIAPSLVLPVGAKLLILDEAAMGELVGFPFHRGVLCAAAVPAEPPEEAILAAERLVVLPHVDNVDNLGLVLRSAAALGMDAVLVGRGPGLFERRTVRVSMGAAWAFPVVQRPDPVPLLEAWRARQPAGEVVGAALAPGATDAHAWRPLSRTALVLGPEGYGLDEAWMRRCDRLVSIPMARGMDSLNVAAAGAILMFALQGGGPGLPES